MTDTTTNLTEAQAARADRRTGTVRAGALGSRVRDARTRADAAAVAAAAALVAALAAGLDTAVCKGYLGNATIAEIDLLAPTMGDAVVATDAGTPAAGASDALVAGDVAQYNGAAWIKLLDAVGGFPPEDTVLLVSDGTLFAPLTDVVDVNKVATFGGASLTATLTVPTDGDSVMIKGESAFNENRLFTFDRGVGWVASDATALTAAQAALVAAGLAQSTADGAVLLTMASEQWVVYEVPASAWTAVAQDETINLPLISSGIAGVMCTDVFLYLATTFDCGVPLAVTVANLEVGDFAGAADDFIKATDLFGGAPGMFGHDTASKGTAIRDGSLGALPTPPTFKYPPNDLEITLRLEVGMGETVDMCDLGTVLVFARIATMPTPTMYPIIL
jgi:hypothetical protein